MIDCKDVSLTFSKRRKTKLQENKNNILCGVNILRKKKEVKLLENLRAGSFGTVPGPILKEIGPATEQSEIC